MRAASARVSASGFSQNTCFRARGAGDHLRRMQRMRRRQQDRVDGTIGEHGIEIAGRRRDDVRAQNSCAVFMSGSTARTIFSRGWLDAASTRLRPQRPRPTIAVSIIAIAPMDGRRRIASMTAALSLSGPRAQWRRAAVRPACGERQMQSAARGFVEDQFGILQCLCDMRLRRKSRVSIFSPLVSMTREYAADLPRCRQEHRGHRAPAVRRMQSLRPSAARLFCRIRLMASLVRLASPMAPMRRRAGREFLRARPAWSMVAGRRPPTARWRVPSQYFGAGAGDRRLHQRQAGGRGASGNR